MVHCMVARRADGREQMKAVVTWSGSRGLAIANAVCDWLAATVPEIQPFISPDLTKGKTWFEELAKQLKDAELGFICLAPPRVASDWQLVEAGAIWKAAANGGLFPLCFRAAAADVPEPLREFQLTEFERKDFERLVRAIMGLVRPGRLRTARDEDVFEQAWAQLKATVEDAFSRPDNGVHTPRGFIHEITGGWWERVKSATGNTQLSWMWIEPLADGNGATIRGDGFGDAGVEASVWRAELVSVRAQQSEPAIDYYWEGRRPDDSGLLFGGKGSFHFTVSPNGSIAEARGEFNHVCLNAAREPTTKVVRLQKATKDEMAAMESNDPKKQRALAQKKLKTWR